MLFLKSLKSKDQIKGQCQRSKKKKYTLDLTGHGIIAMIYLDPQHAMYTRKCTTHFARTIGNATPLDM